MFQIVDMIDELGRKVQMLVRIPANDDSVEALTDPHLLEAA